MSIRARVALIRTTPETVIQDYERVMELAEFRRCLVPSATTILKPDVRRHFPFPSANTPPWQLEGVAQALRGAGYHDLACMLPEGTLIGAFKGHNLNGYLPLLHANGIAVDRGVAGDGSAIPVRERGGQAGANIVFLPTLKADRATTIGGAVGCIVGTTSRSQESGVDERMVDVLAAQREAYAGMFVVMDGTTAGNGPGPYRLQPEIKNAILASSDPVALDAVAATLMGFDPLRDMRYLRLAHARGLGVGDPQAITLVGDSDLARERWRFSAGSGRRYWPIRQPSTGGPLMYLLACVAECYRDYARWPLFERSVFEAWLRGTQWGRLFARYQRLNGYGLAESQLNAAERRSG
jgi:uncharacterized protein (DUF362 family)